MKYVVELSEQEVIILTTQTPSIQSWMGDVIHDKIEEYASNLGVVYGDAVVKTGEKVEE